MGPPPHLMIDNALGTPVFTQEGVIYANNSAYEETDARRGKYCMYSSRFPTKPLPWKCEINATSEIGISYKIENSW